MFPSPSGEGQGGGRVDAIIVGAGPNGLAAAIVLAAAGKSVRMLEAESRIGGGTRSQALTLPGFIHDVCSSVLPLAHASPFLAGRLRGVKRQARPSPAGPR